MKLAIIIGVSDYDRLKSLSACKNDADVMYEIFQKLNKFDDICMISNSPKAFEAKQAVTEFVNKHKANEVEELVFYYTGHGTRDNDDFFFLFSDFKKQRKETTGLGNAELDGFIRALSPALTVKIVDACYSGSAYVKADDMELILKKSASQHSLKNLYFFHSSNSEETSLASDLYSYFTYSFCKSLTQREGPIRYRDIMAYVTDEMGENGYPKPTFVMQADNTEVFGNIEAELIEFIRSKLELEVADLVGMEDEADEGEEFSDSLLQLVMHKSANEYCNQEEAFSNISEIRGYTREDAWPSDIKSLFDIEERVIQYENSIPNEIAIGRWLHKNTSGNYFVLPRYETETYIVEEYKKLPPKPNRKLADLAAMAIDLGFDDHQYKLEKVEKEREVIQGIKYTGETPLKAIRILFKPKFEATENYNLTLAIIFSRKSLVIFSAREKLRYTSWENVDEPKCSDWKVKQLKLKNVEEIRQYFLEVVASTSEYILEDIAATLSA